MKKKRALLVIDVQNDFCAGGSLAVPDANPIITIINDLMSRGAYDIIVFSKDFHPKDHGSFASQHPGKKPFEMGKLGGQLQRMWPDHCIQGTEGAEFHPALLKSFVNFIQQKGMDKTVDSYSAFCDNNKTALTGLDKYLLGQKIEEIDVCGVATEYCASASALDARRLLPRANVNFIEDASRGIDPAGVEAAKRKMKIAGVNIITSAQRLPKPPRPTTGRLSP